MPSVGRDEESTASGIYGVIVGAAVMAASHADRVVAVAVAVLVTLVIYWTAERYARLVAARIHDEHRPDWGTSGTSSPTAGRSYRPRRSP